MSQDPQPLWVCFFYIAFSFFIYKQTNPEKEYRNQQKQIEKRYSQFPAWQTEFWKYTQVKKVFHWFWKQNKEHSALSTNNKEPFWLTLCQTQSFHEVQKVPKTFKYSFLFSSRRFDTMYPIQHHTFTLSTLGLYLNQKQNRINCFHLVKSRRLKDLVRCWLRSFIQ